MEVYLPTDDEYYVPKGNKYQLSSDAYRSSVPHLTANAYRSKRFSRNTRIQDSPQSTGHGWLYMRSVLAFAATGVARELVSRYVDDEQVASCLSSFLKVTDVANVATTFYHMGKLHSYYSGQTTRTAARTRRSKRTRQRGSRRGQKGEQEGVISLIRGCDVWCMTMMALIFLSTYDFRLALVTCMEPWRCR